MLDGAQLATDRGIRSSPQDVRGLDPFADVVVISGCEATEWREGHGSLIHSALSKGCLLAA